MKVIKPDMLNSFEPWLLTPSKPPIFVAWHRYNRTMVTANENLEIESKFDIPWKRVPKIKQLLTFKKSMANHIECIASQNQNISDEYYDTDNYDLHARGAGIRVRKISKEPQVITFKKQASVQSGENLTRRYEIEGEPSVEIFEKISTLATWDHFHLNFLPYQQTNNSVARQFEQAGLGRRVELRTKRRVLEFLIKNRTQIEIAIDRVRINSKVKKSRFAELEIELKKGETSDLIEFIDWVQVQLPKMKKNKYANKYHRSSVELKLLKKRKGEVFRLWQRQLKKIFKRFERMYQKSMDFAQIEDLHQTRISLRQMLTLLEVLRFEVKNSRRTKNLRACRRNIKAIQNQLGKIRDLDVFIDKINRRHDSNDVALEVFDDRLLKLLERERRIARLEAKYKLPKYVKKKFFKSWSRFLEKELKWLSGNAKVQEKLAQLEKDFLKYYTIFNENKVEVGLYHPDTLKALHQMRLVAKEIRYSMKHVAFLLKSDHKAEIKKYANLQTELGELNDLKNYKLFHQKLIKTYGDFFAPILSDHIERIDKAIRRDTKKVIGVIESMLNEVRSEEPARKVKKPAKVDDLTKIFGIGIQTMRKLNEFEIYSLEQLSTLSEQDLDRINLEGWDIRSRALRDEWSNQAKLLLSKKP